MPERMRIPALLRYPDGSGGAAADVVELGTVKQVLYRLFPVDGEQGLKQRREGGLLVFRSKEKPGEYTGFYAKPKEYPAKEAVGQLYIDEGMYQDVLVADEGYPPKFEVQLTAHPWREYCDCVAFLALLAKLLLPEFVPEHKEYIGRGFRQSHYGKQYGNALLGVSTDRVEFYVQEKW